ncbi:WD repeat and SOCS box-containing protein 1 [Schistosoma japonicum]|nr:WD repeat and SOCS box-containing protein 1 [Schistosoma japonicum]
MLVSAFNEIPLRLTLAYHGDHQNNITSCSFSDCGRFFAFVDEPQIVLGYSVNDLLSVCLDENNFKPSPTSHCQISNLLSDESNNTQPLNLHTDCTETITNWKALTSELLNGDSLPINMKPIFRIKTNGNVISMTFAAGDSSFCRLPHRAEKRRSSIVREPQVSLLLLDVPKYVLMDESTLVYLLSAAIDGSLRVGSVHQGGEVRLWDLWDDGNMYGKLRHKFTIPTNPILNNQPCSEIQGEVCTFAWHPFGKHVFLAGERGHAVVLDAESPFSRIAYIRSGHYHRISVAKYSKDGSLLITASYDSCCAVWSVPEYQCLHRFWHMGREPSIPLRGGSNGHHIYGLSLSPDDLYFITICEDRCIRLWPLAPVNSPLKIYFELALQSTQCLHTIRKCVMNNILKEFIHQTTNSQHLSLSIIENNCKTLFQHDISQLHLPSPVIKLILRNFVN